MASIQLETPYKGHFSPILILEPQSGPNSGTSKEPMGVTAVGINTLTNKLEEHELPNIDALPAISHSPRHVKRALELDVIAKSSLPTAPRDYRFIDGDPLEHYAFYSEKLGSGEINLPPDGPEPETIIQLPDLIKALSQLQPTCSVGPDNLVAPLTTTWVPTITGDQKTNTLFVFGTPTNSDPITPDAGVHLSNGFLREFSDGITDSLRNAAAKQGLQVIPEPITPPKNWRERLRRAFAVDIVQRQRSDSDNAALLNLLERYTFIGMEPTQIKEYFAPLAEQLYSKPEIQTQPETTPEPDSRRSLVIRKVKEPFEDPHASTHSQITASKPGAFIVRKPAVTLNAAQDYDRVLLWDQVRVQLNTEHQIPAQDAPITKVRTTQDSFTIWRGNRHEIYTINPNTGSYYKKPATFDSDTVQWFRNNEIRQLIDMVSTPNRADTSLVLIKLSNGNTWLTTVSSKNHGRFEIDDRSSLLQSPFSDDSTILVLSPNRFAVTADRHTNYYGIEELSSGVLSLGELSRVEVEPNIGLTGCTNPTNGERLSLCPTDQNTVICFDTSRGGRLDYTGSLILPGTESEIFTTTLHDRLLIVAAPHKITMFDQVNAYDIDPHTLSKANGQTLTLDQVREVDPLFRHTTLTSDAKVLTPIGPQQLVSLAGLETDSLHQRAFLITDRGDILQIS